jgi:hypothetical protein
MEYWGNNIKVWSLDKSLSVKWQGCTSHSFQCRNGIKQGAVLTPIFFSVYMDCLLDRLASSGQGCYVGHMFMGAVSYADDLSIMAPHWAACQKLLSICDAFADELDVCSIVTKVMLLFLNKRCGFSLPVSFLRVRIFHILIMGCILVPTLVRMLTI